MPVPKGQRFGGRKKGTPNHSTLTLQARMDALQCDPFTVLAHVANGDLPCGVCRGAGKTKYQAGQGNKVFERRCESCYGSGQERISPAERSRAASELAQYLEAKRKAVEVTGPEGGPMQHSITVRFVRAEAK